MRSSTVLEGMGLASGTRCGAVIVGEATPFGAISPPRSRRSLRAMSAPPSLPRELPLDEAEQVCDLLCRLAVRRDLAGGKPRHSGDRIVCSVMHDCRRYASVLGKYP